MDTFCHQSPVTTNTQGEIANVTNDRRSSSDILVEMIKGFNIFTIQSTINDSAYYHSEEDDAESDLNSDQKLATHTSDGKKRRVSDTDTNNIYSPHRSLINWVFPEIIPFFIPPVDRRPRLGFRKIKGLCMRAVQFY